MWGISNRVELIIMAHNFFSELVNSNSVDCDFNATVMLHSHWMYEVFGDCVVNVRQYVAFLVGLVSLLLEIVAQLPQIVVNCRTGSAEKSLSFWLLLLWMLSDSANLLGAVLTKQLTTLVIVAAFYVLIDLASLTQFCLHFCRNGGLNFSGRLLTRSGYERMNMVALILLPSGLLSFCYFSQVRQNDYTSWSVSSWRGRKLLGEGMTVIDVHNTKFIVGYVLGWISAAISFFALPSQVIKNFVRCSVTGLSLSMFVLLTLGDSTYLLSVLLFSLDRAFLLRTLPWIVNITWSIIFDIFVVIQVMAYKGIACSKLKNQAPPTTAAENGKYCVA